MAQTIRKSIGEGWGKGEVFAALAYDETDRFGGLRIKGTYIAKTSAAITGTIRGGNIALTMTAASTANVVEALYVSITSNVKTGAWANAIVGKIDYSTSGAAHGMAAAICAEMIPPNSSLARGSLYALDLEFGCGASSTWGSAGPVAFFKMENWGTKTHFSDNAFMFHLLGETSGTGNLLYNNTIRVRVGTTSWYLPLSSAEGTFTTAYPIVTTYATTAIDIGACVTGIDITSPTTGININGTVTTGINLGGICTNAITAGTLAVPVAMTTTTSDRVVISFSTTVPTDYSTGLYALHTTADDAPAGGVQGVIYGRTNIGHTIQDAYGVRGRVSVTMAASESANMLVGVMAQASITGAFTLTVADSVKGLDASVTQAATSTLTTGSIRAIYVDISGVLADNSGRTQGIFVKQGGGSSAYPDYGILIHQESNNLLAGIMIRTATSCVSPVGIQFTGSSGSITALMAVTGTATYLVDLNGASGAATTITTDSGSVATTWKARIKVKTDDGTVGWINVYSTSNE